MIIISSHVSGLSEALQEQAAVIIELVPNTKPGERFFKIIKSEYHEVGYICPAGNLFAYSERALMDYAQFPECVGHDPSQPTPFAHTSEETQDLASQIPYEVQFNCPTVARALKQGRTAVEIITELAALLELQQRELRRLNDIAPRKMRANGKVFVYHCPDELIPFVN